jgi:hypothetical protein
MIDALELAGAFVLGFILCGAFAGFLIRELIRLHREERRIGLAEMESWRSERREILNRIQHPSRMPVATTGQPVDSSMTRASEERRREMASVGRVVAGSDNGDMELP